MRVMTYNILNGAGRDRLRFVLEVILSEEPDVLALSECQGFAGDGGRKLFEIEEATGLRGFLVPMTDGQPVAIFHHPEWQPAAVHRASGPVFHHGAIRLHITNAQGERMVFVCTHLNPNCPDRRLIEARYLLRGLSDEPLACVLGDLNALSHLDDLTHDLLDDVAPLKRPRFGGDRIDTRVTRTLTAAGLVDCFRHSFPDPGRVRGHTVPTALDTDTQETHVPMRLDYVFASPALAKRLTSCRIPQPFHADRASDHFPLVADFADGEPATESPATSA